jgi:hypothetical protein
MEKIVIVVKGGCVQAVHASNPQTEVFVVDYDNLDSDRFVPASELHFSDNSSAQALIDDKDSNISF